jgi:GNAT superfamily N-acetyltransferase
MIRTAAPADVPELVAMGQAFFEEAGHGERFAFDPETFMHVVACMAQAGLVVVADKGGRAVGMGAIDVAPAFWNRNVVLSREAFWYIQPDHRTGLGRKLLTAMETVAASHGATVFDVVAEPGPRSKPLGRLYEMAGFNPAETTFRKVLRP